MQTNAPQQEDAPDQQHPTESQPAESQPTEESHPPDLSFHFACATAILQATAILVLRAMNVNSAMAVYLYPFLASVLLQTLLMWRSIGPRGALVIGIFLAALAEVGGLMCAFRILGR